MRSGQGRLSGTIAPEHPAAKAASDAWSMVPGQAGTGTPDGGAGSVPVFAVASTTLNRLMPMHLAVDGRGLVQSCGPTLHKLLGPVEPVGRPFLDLFELRRPGGPLTLARLRRRAGERLILARRGMGGPTFRGLAMPLWDGGGLLLNLSFGIGILDAVTAHRLTDADFAPTDFAIELLYMFEAQTAVSNELRDLAGRLQGAKQAAEDQALTDTLTGLRNRRALDLSVAQIIDAAIPFAVMHLDLDFFKAVNDRHGHAAGDGVLREVARVLREEVRRGDLAARIGGDEFVAVFPGLVDPVILRRIADRLVTRIAQPVDCAGHVCVVSASIGIAISTALPQVSATGIHADADAALYASKRAGRGQARFHDPGAGRDGAPD